MSAVTEICRKAKEASRRIALAPSPAKNAMLTAICAALKDNADRILTANAADIAAAEAAGRAPHFIDRLKLSKARIDGIADGVAKLVELADPVGEVLESWTAPNGLRIEKARVPLGVVGIIYEARPNVTVDAAALCLKSGNAVVLRGSSETLRSNAELVGVMREAVKVAGGDPECIQLITDTAREGVNELMKLNGYVDVLIPRGGAGLIRSVVENSTIPVIQTGVGNCHVYVEASADQGMAVEVLINAKVSRPSVCNAAESLLVDAAIAEEFLPKAAEALSARGVRLLGCTKTLEILSSAQPAAEEDFYREFNDYILSVKVVEGLNEAIDHVNKYGTQHSEAIVTRSEPAAQRFLNEVDAACVYVNASTRFTDGFEFGFGAEMGISTQKLHARGPMGLKELTSYKYRIRGEGQTR